jgi:hypothetical protein
MTMRDRPGSWRAAVVLGPELVGLGLTALALLVLVLAVSLGAPRPDVAPSDSPSPSADIVTTSASGLRHARTPGVAAPNR